VASIVRELRVKKGLTQEELALRCGVSRITIVAIENSGLARVKAKTLCALADALGVDPGFLFASDVHQELQNV
jgi:transcriptional regulator with XRE-family HTH domain